MGLAASSPYQLHFPKTIDWGLKLWARMSCFVQIFYHSLRRETNKLINHRSYSSRDFQPMFQYTAFVVPSPCPSYKNLITRGTAEGCSSRLAWASQREERERGGQEGRRENEEINSRFTEHSLMSRSTGRWEKQNLQKEKKKLAATEDVENPTEWKGVLNRQGRTEPSGVVWEMNVLVLGHRGRRLQKGCLRNFEQSTFCPERAKLW